MKKSLLLLAILCTALCGAVRAQVIPVYTSAQVAPLVLPDGGGIYPDMVAYLNRQQLGLTFKLVYLPRKRLQLKVESGQLDGIVIGMMPHWFDDVAQKKYFWTAPFAVDRYMVVLPAGSSYTPGATGMLTGRTLGMVLGYSYPDLEEWMHQQGVLRTDALSDEHNLEKLRLGRLDSVAIAESVLRYYRRKHPADHFLIYPLPSRQTERRFLVPHKLGTVYDKIAPVLRKAKDDPEWQRAMLHYE
ncbi:transporter substrate-binding domain-containing protein [Duganella sp. FT135W]|uniref:Transporter substrate-binding domain-containing protein n=1 Tax=Duganella flavida TaxID=2692175 RepID=A0A6L8KB41_9BURK|nr:transporter substrate-binding domain-containing protein [Duganella flavida]MYM23092.1 transporter substrate-binding domain-containing protein [Duganella flavida]